LMVAGWATRNKTGRTKFRGVPAPRPFVVGNGRPPGGEKFGPNRQHHKTPQRAHPPPPPRRRGYWPNRGGPQQGKGEDHGGGGGDATTQRGPPTKWGGAPAGVRASGSLTSVWGNPCGEKTWPALRKGGKTKKFPLWRSGEQRKHKGGGGTPAKLLLPKRACGKFCKSLIPQARAIRLGGQALFLRFHPARGPCIDLWGTGQLKQAQNHVPMHGRTEK